MHNTQISWLVYVSTKRAPYITHVSCIAPQIIWNKWSLLKHIAINNLYIIKYMFALSFKLEGKFQDKE